MRMLEITSFACLALAASTMAGQAAGQPANQMNFADRREVIINNTPDVQLSGFHFRNDISTVGARLNMDLKWQNTGQKDITAFDVVVLYFDQFNRPVLGVGGRWLVPGQDSANWSALKPGESGSDGLRHLSSEETYTGVVYVKDIRFADGTIWTAPQADVEQRIRASLPELHDLGAVDLDNSTKPQP